MRGSLKIGMGLALLRLCIIVGLAIGLFAAGPEAMRTWLWPAAAAFVSAWLVTVWLHWTQKRKARAHG